jgi:hypothetical protein
MRGGHVLDNIHGKCHMIEWFARCRHHVNISGKIRVPPPVGILHYTRMLP